jgi:3-methyl-2-oxobutanoate hydroxymethyltransferase
MVVAGRDSTIPATLGQMIYHGEIVARAVTRAMVVVDLPFPLQHLGTRGEILAAARLLKETGCQAVKLEGTAGQAGVIAALVAAGIPVMGHVGLRPQAVHQLGGYRMPRDGEALSADAAAAADKGLYVSDRSAWAEDGVSRVADTGLSMRRRAAVTASLTSEPDIGTTAERVPDSDAEAATPASIGLSVSES